MGKRAKLHGQLCAWTSVDRGVRRYCALRFRVNFSIPISELSVLIDLTAVRFARTSGWRSRCVKGCIQTSSNQRRQCQLTKVVVCVRMASGGRLRADGPWWSSACADGPWWSSACADGPWWSSACADGPWWSSACADGPWWSSACADGPWWSSACADPTTGGHHSRGTPRSSTDGPQRSSTDGPLRPSADGRGSSADGLPQVHRPGRSSR